jgi:hypothetical protein
MAWWAPIASAVGSNILGGLLGGDDDDEGGNVMPQQMQLPGFQQLQTTGWGGMGPTPTPQTFTQEGMPSWMQAGPGMTYGQQGPTNWFAAPWWGMSAANPEQALTQEDLMYQPPPPPSPAPSQVLELAKAFGRGWDGPKPLNMYYARALQPDATDAELLAEHEQNTWRNWRRSRKQAGPTEFF